MVALKAGLLVHLSGKQMAAWKVALMVETLVKKKVILLADSWVEWMELLWD